MLALGSLFGAPAANAACVNYPIPPIANTPPANINNWPRNTEPSSNPTHSMLYYCGTANPPQSDAKFDVAWQAAQVIGNRGGGTPYYMANFYTNNKQRIYVYATLADLNASWNTNYQENNGTIYGVTLASGDTGNPGVPINSVGIILSKNGVNFPDNAIKGAVYHELGHPFDRLKGNPSSTGGSQFTTKKNDDIFQLNAVGASSPPKYGRDVVFNGITIPANCQALYQDYQNTTHWQVAQCVWPYFTGNQELFANIFGKRLGGLLADQATQPSLYQFSNWITTYFPETALYMDSVTSGGTP